MPKMPDDCGIIYTSKYEMMHVLEYRYTKLRHDLNVPESLNLINIALRQLEDVCSNIRATCEAENVQSKK